MSLMIFAGATICKTVNRMCGTSLAGLLGIGVHWVASKAGDQFEPIIVGASLFLLGIYNFVHIQYCLRECNIDLYFHLITNYYV